MRETGTSDRERDRHVDSAKGARMYVPTESCCVGRGVAAAPSLSSMGGMGQPHQTPHTAGTLYRVP